MQLDPNFIEFIESLIANDVAFLVVGGYAVALHGHPRYTADLDIWVRRDAENAGSLLAALQQFGFGDVGLTAEHFLRPSRVVQLGYPPLRIDLLTSLDGVEFAECHARRVDLSLEGLDVPFVALEDLRANKRATGRYQDLADLEALDED